MAGKIDVGLKLFTLEDVIPELDYRILEESHLAVIMNENHPFAERKELHMSELAGEKFVFLGKNSSHSDTVSASQITTMMKRHMLYGTIPTLKESR